MLVSGDQYIKNLKARVAELEDAIRPFHAAVFNDNGDITISTGHITLGDWLKLARVMRNQE